MVGLAMVGFAKVVFGQPGGRNPPLIWLQRERREWQRVLHGG